MGRGEMFLKAAAPSGTKQGLKRKATKTTSLGLGSTSSAFLMMETSLRRERVVGRLSSAHHNVLVLIRLFCPAMQKESGPSYAIAGCRGLCAGQQDDGWTLEKPRPQVVVCEIGYFRVLPASGRCR